MSTESEIEYSPQEDEDFLRHVCKQGPIAIAISPGFYGRMRTHKEGVVNLSTKTLFGEVPLYVWHRLMGHHNYILYWSQEDLDEGISKFGSQCQQIDS